MLSLQCPHGAGDKEDAIGDYQQAIKLNPSLKGSDRDVAADECEAMSGLARPQMGPGIQLKAGLLPN